MESLDGRIDCAMTEKLAGSEEYYSAIKELEIPTVIFGRVTAQMEVTSEPPFSGDAGEPLGKEAVHKAEIDEYENAVSRLKVAFPDGRFPSMKTLKADKSRLSRLCNQQKVALRSLSEQRKQIKIHFNLAEVLKYDVNVICSHGKSVIIDLMSQL